MIRSIHGQLNIAKNSKLYGTHHSTRWCVENLTIKWKQDGKENNIPEILRPTVNLTKLSHLDELQNELRKWRIKLNEIKSTHVTCILKRSEYPPVYLNYIQIPHVNGAEYLVFYLDIKLTWKNM